MERESVRPITNREFSLFQALIYREAGIYLSSSKLSLLVGRLMRRLRELRLASFEAYYRMVEEDRGERIRLLDAISTNETHFFREPKHFKFLEQRVFPEWREYAKSGLRRRRIRVWSAGCSTGEEPYSLAMLLLRHFPFSSGWEIEILATDLSTRALEKAQAAVWPIKKAEEIPPPFLRSFMLQGIRSREGKMKAGPEICSLIHFERLNLNTLRYPVNGKFDLIFCRNVLIYFDSASRTGVIDRLLVYLESSGYLFVGHSESLAGLTDRLRCVFPTVYSL